MLKMMVGTALARPTMPSHKGERSSSTCTSQPDPMNRNWIPKTRTKAESQKRRKFG